MINCTFGDSVIGKKDCVIAIGVFDGLHIGHQEIMNRTVELAQKLKAASVVLSFNVNPKMAKGSEASCKPLSSRNQFNNLLSKKGLDYNCVIDFSDNMSKLTGEEFIAGLCTSYNVKAVVVGKGFRCGNPSSSAGEPELKKLIPKYRTSAYLEVVDSVIRDGETVSSSLIRRCLLTGDVEKASSLLGRAYSLDFFDVIGQEKDNRLFYNIRTLEQLLPKEGLYKVRATGNAAGALNSNPKETDALAVISEDYLVLDLPVRIKPDKIFFL